MESHCKEILKYMQQGNSITQLEALAKFGCFRLGARIWDLKNEGYTIDKVNRKLPNGKYIAEYKLNIRG